jgi:hypothetical protein
MLRALSRLPVVDARSKAGLGRWGVVANAPQRETAQEGTGMDGVADVDIQQVEGPSASCGVDSWDNPTEGEGTVLDDAGSVHAVAEPYTGWQVGAGTDTWEAEGRHSAGHRMKNGGIQDGKRGVPFR